MTNQTHENSGERPISDADHELLVAYLDGELETQQRVDLELRLSVEPELLAQLKSLEQAWEMLDFLPQHPPSETFTETTLEMVAVAATGQVQSLEETVVSQKKTSIITRVCLGIVTLLLGFVIVRLLVTAPNRQLMQQLPVVARVDLYRHVDNIEFLDELLERGVFKHTDLADEDYEQLITPVPVAYNKRDDYLETLTADARKELAERKFRFDQLTPENRGAMVALHKSVEDAENSDEILRVCGQYYLFVRDLSPAMRSEFLELSADERIARIESYRQQQLSGFQKRLSLGMAPSDYRVLMEWLTTYFKNHREELEQALSDEDKRLLSNSSHPAARILIPLFRSRITRDFPYPSPEEIETLASQLSPNAARVLRQAPAGQRQVELIGAWVKGALATRIASSVSDERLQSFYKELDTKQRELLENLPRYRWKQRLKLLYLQKQFAELGLNPWPFMKHGPRPDDRHRDDRERPREERPRVGPRGPN